MTNVCTICPRRLTPYHIVPYNIKNGSRLLGHTVEYAHRNDYNNSEAVSTENKDKLSKEFNICDSDLFKSFLYTGNFI